MYDKNFETVMTYLLRSEGGFNDDPNDRGGRTNLGERKRLIMHGDEKRGCQLRM